MGKRVRGRKRDGRRSSLPPPPPGEENVAQGERDSESDDLSARSRSDDRVSVSLPPDSAASVVDEGDEGGGRGSSSDAGVVVAAEVIAVDVVVVPKSASALLSAALPSSARTKVVAPPSSVATPAASPDGPTPATADEEPEPTPVIDMPALLEERRDERTDEHLEAAASAIPTAGEPSAEVTRPDVKALPVEASATASAAADVHAESPAEGDTVVDLKRADVPPRQGSIPDATEVSFFDPAAVSAHIARAHEPSDAHDIHTLSQAELLHRRRALPEVAARRARLAKYVKVTVGTAAALLVLAALLHLSARPGRAGGQTSEMLVAPPPTAAEPHAEPVKTTAATVAATTPNANAAVDAAPAAGEAPSASAAAASAAPATDMSPDAAAAAALPLAKFAQLSYEKGKLADAIDAGNQATALDPTDARSWLVLGGAYQDRGDITNARRCYNACVGHATRGPVNECRALGGR